MCLLGLLCSRVYRHRIEIRIIFQLEFIVTAQLSNKIPLFIYPAQFNINVVQNKVQSFLFAVEVQIHNSLPSTSNSWTYSLQIYIGFLEPEK